MDWQFYVPYTNTTEPTSSRINENEVYIQGETGRENVSSSAESLLDPDSNSYEELSLVVYSPPKRMSFIPLNLRKRKLEPSPQPSGGVTQKRRISFQNDGQSSSESVDLPRENPFPPNRLDFNFNTGPRFNRPQSGEVNSFVKFKHAGQGASARSDRVHINHSPRFSPIVLQQKPEISVSGDAPIELRLSNNNFDYFARMDTWERGMWTFFWNNFCPGRSILVESNPWYEFARLVEDSGIKCAILSLVSIYIYDYKPDEMLRAGAIRSYDIATHSLSSLLSMGEELVDHVDQDIAITLLIIFSIRDALLLDNALYSSDEPRWCRGFKLAQTLLERTESMRNQDSQTSAQLSSLRVCQSMVVGRAVILPQMMMKLPKTKRWDPRTEVRRYKWLLCDEENEMYKIHGGCGFSRKVLYAISQITFLATALKQHKDNAVYPTTVKFISNELRELKQWCCDWNGDGTVWQSMPSPTMEWVRRRPFGSTLTTAVEVAQATAETWRLLGIIYAECRGLRVPRDSPQIIAYLDDMATCIRLLPTSGSLFTAQTPFLPIFLLGAIATLPQHRQTSQQWFEEVMETPVRSTIPRAYGVLQRLWARNALTLLSIPPDELPININDRHPWWEDLVEEITDEAHGCGVFDASVFW